MGKYEKLVSKEDFFCEIIDFLTLNFEHFFFSIKLVKTGT